MKIDTGHAVLQPPGFLVTCWFGSRETAITAVDVHPVIPHAHVNGITSVSRNSFLGTVAQYCLFEASFGAEFAGFFVYSIAPYIELDFNSCGVQYIWVLPCPLLRYEG